MQTEEISLEFGKQLTAHVSPLRLLANLGTKSALFSGNDPCYSIREFHPWFIQFP